MSILRKNESRKKSRHFSRWNNPSSVTNLEKKEKNETYLEIVHSRNNRAYAKIHADGKFKTRNALGKLKYRNIGDPRVIHGVSLIAVVLTFSYV